MFKIIMPAEKLMQAAWWQGFGWGAFAVVLIVLLALILRGDR